MHGIRKSLLQLVFSGSCMLRWNDKLRPAELWEVDKQAHKMILAFVLWHESARALPPREALLLGRDIIEGGLFDYFYRLVITDIKPPVFYRIKENTEHYRQLTEHVLRELEPVVRPLDEAFWQRMREYHHQGDSASPACRILTAAHLYASQWEFRLIQPLNKHFDDEMPEIDASFKARLDAFRDLPGMPELLDRGHALGRFANLCGQLRFQIRWTQAPRIPTTSVLGHMFLVASYAYFFSLTVGACTARRNNDFFCGLFHDMPELLTRDIISPVKRSVDSLPALIRDYEEEELSRRIFRPLEDAGYSELAARLGYYLGLATGSEFHETIRNPDGSVCKLDSFEELHERCNADALDPKDGRLIKACDTLAAFMEAHSSIRNGVSSPHLQEAVVRLRTEIRHAPVEPLQMDALLGDFD
ncbi:MAG: HD domain-containing protein [Desulfovibrionaceae bacterium]|nr:HD domain-containing protein [Desulfovibrionaceae bacterium]